MTETMTGNDVSQISKIDSDDPIAVLEAIENSIASGKKVSTLNTEVNRSVPWVYQHYSIRNLSARLRGFMKPGTPKESFIPFEFGYLISQVKDHGKQDEIYEKHKGRFSRVAASEIKQLLRELKGSAEKGEGPQAAAPSTLRQFHKGMEQLDTALETLSGIHVSDWATIEAIDDENNGPIQVINRADLKIIDLKKLILKARTILHKNHQAEWVKTHLPQKAG